jgi:dTDP-4-dehydrorhamnose reductase
MKVMVFGRGGWLAQKFADSFDTVVCPADVMNVPDITDLIMGNVPDVVINCAGKTGRPNIDWCAENEDNMSATRHVNSIAPSILQACCRITGARLVHLSSGCLWEEGEDLKEEVNPVPPSFYSQTKSEGEAVLQRDGGEAGPNLIIRLRMPFDGSGNQRCLISKLTKYEKVISIANSLTYIPDLVDAVHHLIHSGDTGVYNVVNPGPVTGEQILEAYKKHVDPSHEFELVTMDYLLENGHCTQGRSNCTLNGDKLAATGFQMPLAVTRLEEAMINLGKLKKDGKLG